MKFLFVEQLFSVELVNRLNFLYEDALYVSFINELLNNFSRLM